MEGKKVEAGSKAMNDVCVLSSEDLFHNRVALAQNINLSDESLERGTEFEIASEQVDMEELCGDAEDALHYESLFGSLSLGAGNGILDEDDSSNSDDGTEPFEKLARNMLDVSGDGGVLKREVWPGSGGDIPMDAIVTFHYSAFLEYSDEPFDSTHLRNKPERKRMDGCLPGVFIALMTMRKGETSRFLIKPQYAYGQTGCPPRIPSNETIFYEIHVISFVDSAAADDYDRLDCDEQGKATFEKKFEGARGYHQKGNDLYREGNLVAAKNAYMRAAWIMEDAKLQNEEEEVKRGKILIKVRSNLAQVFLDLKEPAQACTQCKLGIGVRGFECDEIRSKLHFRLGKAKTILNDFDGALKEFRNAQRLRPNNADISAALASLLSKKVKYEEQEKFIYKKMFQSDDKENKKEAASEENQKKKDANHNIINARPEFEKIVEEQILHFVADPNVKELPFPSNLSQAEIACVAAAAKAAKLKVTLTQRGMASHLYITKST